MPAVWNSTSQPVERAPHRAPVEHVGVDDLDVAARSSAAQPAPVADRHADLVAALARGGRRRARPTKPVAPVTQTFIGRAPAARQPPSGRFLWRAASCSTDTSPSDARLEHAVRPVPSNALRESWLTRDHFGLLTAACRRLAVHALLAVPAAAAPARARRAGREVPRRDDRGGARTRPGEAAGVRSASAVDGRTERVDVPDGERRAQAGGQLERADPRVVHAVPNYVATRDRLHSQRPRQGGPGRVGRAAVELHRPVRRSTSHGAWDNAIAAGNPGGGGVTVAVLDTGVAYRTSPDRRYLLAPDLDRSRFVRGYDFVRNNKLPYDRNGHGTFVAGVIAQSTEQRHRPHGRRLPRRGSCRCGCSTTRARATSPRSRAASGSPPGAARA